MSAPCPTCLCAQLRNSCRGGNTAARCCWQSKGRKKRAAEHLPRQKQLRAALSKHHSEKYVRKRHFNLLEMSPVSMGVWHFWNAALYNFFFYLELCFHSYPCKYIFGQICSFWWIHWSLATIESWDVGPCFSSLGQESGKHEAIFPDPEFLSAVWSWSDSTSTSLSGSPLTSQSEQIGACVHCANSHNCICLRWVFIAIRKASTENFHPSF